MSGTLIDLQGQEKACTRCGLRAGCKQVVPGNGPSPCPIMCVGEGPGEDEDDQGRPFVGLSGQLLDKMLRSAGLPRDEVFVSNVLRCRPPGNRVPKSSEIESCKPWLWREMQVVRPTAVIALGGTASRLLVRPEFGYLKDIVGRAFPAPYLGRNGVIVPVYHPSYLLRGRMQHLEAAVKTIARVKHYAEGIRDALRCH